jgi:hypothetical protein
MPSGCKSLSGSCRARLKACTFKVVRFLLLLCSLIWQSRTTELGKEAVTCTDLTNMEIAPRDRRTIGSIALFTTWVLQKHVRACGVTAVQRPIAVLSACPSQRALRGSKDMHCPRVSGPNNVYPATVACASNSSNRLNLSQNKRKIRVLCEKSNPTP